MNTADNDTLLKDFILSGQLDLPTACVDSRVEQFIAIAVDGGSAYTISAEDAAHRFMELFNAYVAECTVLRGQQLWRAVNLLVVANLGLKAGINVNIESMAHLVDSALLTPLTRGNFYLGCKDNWQVSHWLDDGFIFAGKPPGSLRSILRTTESEDWLMQLKAANDGWTLWLVERTGSLRRVYVRDLYSTSNLKVRQLLDCSTDERVGDAVAWSWSVTSNCVMSSGRLVYELCTNGFMTHAEMVHWRLERGLGRQ